MVTAVAVDIVIVVDVQDSHYVGFQGDRCCTTCY